MTHDFNELYVHYPAIIEQMEDTFTSHEFILKLAQQHQRLYVEALYSYRNTLRLGREAPFMMVHGQLSRHLDSMSEMVIHLGEVESIDIFGYPNKCAQWRKI